MMWKRKTKQRCHSTNRICIESADWNEENINLRHAERQFTAETRKEVAVTD